MISTLAGQSAASNSAATRRALQVCLEPHGSERLVFPPVTCLAYCGPGTVTLVCVHLCQPKGSAAVTVSGVLLFSCHVGFVDGNKDRAPLVFQNSVKKKKKKLHREVQIFHTFKASGCSGVPPSDALWLWPPLKATEGEMRKKRRSAFVFPVHYNIVGWTDNVSVFQQSNPLKKIFF